ncbi:serine hydrolase [Bacillus sp. 165]|nr:serine hydrolase [Bacillus sp. 165]
MRNMSFFLDIEQLLQKIEGTVSLALEGEVTYHYQSDIIHRSASLIKMPILTTALFQAEQDILDLNETVSCSVLSKVKGSGVIASFREEAVLIAHDLLTLMITVSDNDATNWAIKKIGMVPIQQTIKDLGLTNTALNRYMLQDPEEAGGDNFTTARDMVKLLHYMDTSPLQDLFYRPLLEQQFREKLPGALEYETRVKVANKTGGLQGVVHDTARFQAGGRVIYAALLCSNIQDEPYTNYIQSQIGKRIAQYLIS